MSTDDVKEACERLVNLAFATYDAREAYKKLANLAFIAYDTGFYDKEEMTEFNKVCDILDKYFYKEN